MYTVGTDTTPEKKKNNLTNVRVGIDWGHWAGPA